MRQQALEKLAHIAATEQNSALPANLEDSVAELERGGSGHRPVNPGATAAGLARGETEKGGAIVARNKEIGRSGAPSLADAAKRVTTRTSRLGLRALASALAAPPD
jgi:hypothetical protein